MIGIIGAMQEEVEDLKAVAKRRIRRQTDLVIVSRTDKGIGDDLVESEAAADLADAPLAVLLGREAAAG